MNEPRRVRYPGDNDPMMHLLAAMISPRDSIERSEAEGQRRLVASTQLPIEGTEGDAAAKWEAMGVRLGEKTDELFRNVVLPAGWKFKPSEHSMWSYLHDNKGRRRASIFYKAAFYDRRASCSIDRRFSVQRDYAHKGSIRHQAKDGDAVLFTSSEHPDAPRLEWDAHDKLTEDQRAECSAWLDANRPGWSDPAREWEIA